MLAFEIWDDIERVPESMWAMDDDGFGALYRTREWLKDSQHKLGDRHLYVGVYQDGAPVALFPLVFFERPCDYARWDPARMLAKANLPWRGRVAMCASLYGNGRAFKMNPDCADWPPLIDQLRRFVGATFDAAYLLFPRTLSNDDRLANVPGSVRTDSPAQGILHLGRYTDWQEYLSALSHNARRSFALEERKARNAGVAVVHGAVQEFDLDLLGRLGANVFAKYGVDFPQAQLTRFIAYMDQEFPGRAHIIATVRHDTILCYTLVVVYGSTMYVKMLGRDYDHDQFATYFLAVYHEPIKLALQERIRFVEYGAEAGAAKVRRGVGMIPAHNYLFGLC